MGERLPGQRVLEKLGGGGGGLERDLVARVGNRSENSIEKKERSIPNVNVTLTLIAPRLDLEPSLCCIVIVTV